MLHFVRGALGTSSDAAQDTPPDEQQESSFLQPPAHDKALEHAGSKTLKAVWDNGAPEPERGAQKRARGESASPTARARGATRERQASALDTPGRKRPVNAVQLETVGQALAHCVDLMEQQVKRAHDSNAAMNVAVAGDAVARKKARILLSDGMMRALFIRVVALRHSWPRIRSLFGAPPFHFLRPEDAGLLRATGIAAGRSNMTYKKVNETSNYSQFGVAHLVDAFDREYRVVAPASTSETDSLPCDVEHVQPSAYVFLNVRVPRRSQGERLRLMKDAGTRRKTVFPESGELLKLRYTRELRAIWSDAHDAEFTLLVNRVAPREVSSSTAAVLAVKQQ